VIRRFEIGLAVHPGVKAPLLPTLTAEGPMEQVTEGESLRVGDLTVDVLGPSPDLRDVAAVSVTEQAPAEGPGLNDASVVLRVNWAGECVLFTGDVEDAGQQELLDHPDRIDCTVMKAPHHGSGRLLPEFVEAVDPEWVAISVGPNSYGHPSAKALEAFDEVGAETLRTDRLDDVVVEMDTQGRVQVGH
jgi:competence protein ComEC